MSKNSTLTQSAPQGESGVASIVTLVDALRNPLFSLTDCGHELKESQKHFVNGELKVEIKNRKLSGIAADVFHMLIHRAKELDFELREDILYFNSAKLLRAMGWQTGGKEYKRLEKCFEELVDVRIKFTQPVGNRRVTGFLQFFHTALLWRQDSGENPNEQRGLFRSQISFTPFLLNLCRKGRLKGIHPVYYRIRSRLMKRLLELLSAYASDLAKWKVDILWLRDVIPMEGKKYKYPANVRDNLSRALDKLQDQNIIFRYEFEKVNKQWFVSIWPNPEYLYSHRRPAKLDAHDGKVIDISNGKAISPTLVQQVKSIGVTEQTAKQLIATFGEEAVVFQIEHLEFLVAEGAEPKRPGGWLVEAIKNEYRPPKKFKTRAEREREKLKKQLDREIEALWENEQYFEVMEKCSERLGMGKSRAVTARLDDAQRRMEQQLAEKQTDKQVESLSPEEKNKIHDATLERISKNPLLKNRTRTLDKRSPVYQSTFDAVAREFLADG
ncbi:MAG: hypothetical protein GY866_04415 [Proteobacteria bacterium]|nr:hypothetical protein [Pseudomonadota bacterium]